MITLEKEIPWKSMKRPKSATDMYVYVTGPVKMDQVGTQNLTNDRYVKAIEVKFLPSINKLLGNISLLTEHQYYT